MNLLPPNLRNVFTTVPLVQHSYMQSTFPSVFIALRIFLTLPVTNCEGERSFSHLARIKNELRTTQTQQRLIDGHSWPSRRSYSGAWNSMKLSLTLLIGEPVRSFSNRCVWEGDINIYILFLI